MRLTKFKDPNWRLTHLYRIVNKYGKEVQFKPNVIQAHLNKSSTNRKMVLKARQFGVSTNEILKLLDTTMFNANTTSCIIAHENDSIKKLFRIVRRAYEFMPEELRPRLDRGGGSKYEMYFPDINSIIYCDLESRGDTIQNLHVSEAAFIKDPDRLLATLQAVPLGGNVTLETTPNGIGNFFYDLWQEIDGTYEKHFFPWYMFPDYAIRCYDPLVYTEEEKEFKQKAYDLFGIKIVMAQMNFRRFKQSELKHKFIQEYPEDDQSCFLSSDDAIFDLSYIKSLLDNTPKPIKTVKDIEIYKANDKKDNYVIGADTAQGIGGDYSVAVVINTTTMEEAAILRGQYSPFAFAHKLKELASLYSHGYKRPLISVECNNHGHAVLLELYEHIKYPNLYHHKKDRIGWITDSVTRPIMLDTFIDAINNKSVKINSKHILKECLTFINKKGKAQAADKKHDDCIMACAIAIQIAIKQLQSVAIYDNIKDKILI